MNIPVVHTNILALTLQVDESVSGDIMSLSIIYMVIGELWIFPDILKTTKHISMFLVVFSVVNVVKCPD